LRFEVFLKDNREICRTMIKKTFKKTERLKSRTTIGRLFKEGQSFGMYPLRIVWVTQPSKQASPVQFTVSVPKKKFPKAVHRNRIRRQVKEAYRLNKHGLYQHLEDSDLHFACMVLYVAKTPLPYQQIETAMQKLIKKFLKKIQSQPAASTNPS